MLINKVPLFIAYLRCTSWFFLSKFFTIPWIPLWIVEALPESYDLTHPSNCLSGQFLLLIPCSKICPDTNWFLWTLVKMTLSFCLSPILFPFCLSSSYFLFLLSRASWIIINFLYMVLDRYTITTLMCYYRIHVSADPLMNSIWFLNHSCVKLGILAFVWFLQPTLLNDLIYH